MIEALLPRTRRNVLALLFGHPDEAFYLRQVVRVTGSGRGAVARELGELAEAGVVTRERKGNSTYYQADPTCPLFSELKSMMLKTAGLADVVRAALSEVKGVRLAFIFGSMAKGMPDVRSDVDVLIVGEATFVDLVRAFRPAQGHLGREITPTLYTPAEFAQKVGARHHFLTRVLAEPKIMLVGDAGEIERLGRSAS